MSDFPLKIFIDTSAWIEIILEGEQFHDEISKYFISNEKKGAKFLTSDYVLDESFTRLLTNQGTHTARLLRKKTQEAEKSNHLLILQTNAVVFNKAWAYFEKFSEHKLSFTDATIYTFVKDLKIDEILTLDQGFKKVGLKVKPNLR